MARFEGLRRFFRLDRPADVTRAVDEELRFHFDMAVRELVAAGASEADARREAERRFGDVQGTRASLEAIDRDRVGQVRRREWWSGLGQDLRYALRGLRLKPGFTLGVMLTLGLGIGANATMFGIVDRLMFRAPAFLPRAEEVSRLYFVRTFDGKETASASTSYRRFRDVTELTSSFSVVAAVFPPQLAIGTGDEASELPVQAVSASFWRLFDAPPAAGRYFGDDEDQAPIGACVTVLGYAFWRTRFGGRAGAIGQRLRIGKNEYTIIGVAPRGFAGVGLRLPAAFIPITAGLDENFMDGGGRRSLLETYGWTWPNVVVRRKPGVSLAQATADLDHADLESYRRQRVEQPGAAPDSVRHPHVLAAPVQFERGPRQSADAKVALWLVGVSVIVLIVACANVGNLLLARAFSRRREIAVRLALGISRSRLAAQLLAESLLLALSGAVAGLAVAQWGGNALRATLLPNVTWTSAASDRRVLAFTLIAALATGILAGLAPIVFAARSDVAGALKSGTREGTYHRSRLRTALLVLQGGLSVVLLVGAGLFVRSFRNARETRLGFDVDRLLNVNVEMRGVRQSGTEAAELRQKLADEAAALPGVEHAARALTVPFSSSWSLELEVAGLDTAFLNRYTFQLQAATPGYLETMGTRLLRGRSIEPTDQAGSEPVIVVSQSMANLLWPGKDALGQCARVGTENPACRTVVGIAEDIRLDLSDDSTFTYYMPASQFQPALGGIMVRTRGDAESQVPAVRRALQALMPSPAYVTVTPFTAIIATDVRQWRLGATMFTVFGVLALVVAAVGLYSVIAYGVAQRTHELGVRVALGARAADVLRLVLGEGLRLALVAVALGLAAAALTAKFIAPLLYRTSARDPLILGGVGAVMIGIAVMASLLPALRAARVDPNVALRAD